jgi:hypothetical protein
MGLLLLLRVLNWSRLGIKPHESLMGQGILLIVVVLALILVHGMEIWLYAFLYLVIGALPDLETSLYYSTTAFTSVGFGDVVLPVASRLIGAIEAANGFMLFGWSTAFLIGVTGKLRSLEHDWIERKD